MTPLRSGTQSTLRANCKETSRRHAAKPPTHSPTFKGSYAELKSTSASPPYTPLASPPEVPRLRLRPLNRHLVPDAQTSDRGPSASSPKLRFARVLLCPSPVARPRVIPAAAPCTDLDLHFAVAHRSRLRLRLRLLASSSTHLATLCPRAHLASSHRPSCVLRLPRLRLPPQPTVKSRGCPTLRPALRPPSPPALRSPALFQLRTTLISAPRSGALRPVLRPRLRHPPTLRGNSKTARTATQGQNSPS